MVTRHNYRREYGIYLGVVFTRDIHVHHIDHNKDNNDFSNLVAIHNDLHGRYHFLERIYKERSFVLKYRRPGASQYERYNFNDYLTGEWRNKFNGSASKYLYNINDIHILTTYYREFDEAKEKHLKTLKEVLLYKKQQSKPLNHGRKNIPSQKEQRVRHA